MRQGQQNRRGRGRNNNNHGHGHGQSRRGQNPLSRNYESNGPGVKIRGNAAHIAEKYMSLARDALSSGDSIMAENYLQHAEHYNRIIMAAQQPAEGAGVPGGMQHRPRAIPAEFGAIDDDGEGDVEDFAGQMGVPSSGGVAGMHGGGGHQSGQQPGGSGGFHAQGQPQGYGQQQNRNGYGHRGEGYRGDGQRSETHRQDGGRGDRFARDRDGRDRDGRDRDGGQYRSQPRHDQARQDHQRQDRHDHGRRDQPRHEHGRFDAQRHEQQREDRQRHDQPRHSDFGRQPQPVVETAPMGASGFGTGSQLPSFVADPVPTPFLQPQVGPAPVAAPAPVDVVPGPGAEAARVARMTDDGEQVAMRRERQPRPAAGEEGYRPPRRRRAPIAAAEPAEAGSNGADGAGDIDSATRRRAEPDVSGD